MAPPDPDQSRRNARKGLLLLVALTVGWGLVWPLMKVAVTELPVLSFRALTGAVGAAGLFALARLVGQSWYVPPGERRPLVVAALLNVTGWLLFSALAISMMPASRAVLIAYTMPLWAFLAAIPLLGDRPTRSRLLGLALGLGGIAVLGGDDMIRLGQVPLGAAIMVAGAICFGVGGTYQKYIQWQTPILSLSAWQFLIGGLPLIAAALLVERDASWSLSGFAWFAIAYSIVIGNIFGVTAWLKILALLPVKTASLSVLATPVIGITASALLLGEPIGLTELAAAVLVVGAIATVIPGGRS